MDNRLDFFNALKKHVETLSEDDALLVLTNNIKQGDCTTSLYGNWEFLSSLFSIDGYVNLTEENRESYDNIRKMILNTTINIINTDEKVKDTFRNFLNAEKIMTIYADSEGGVYCPYCEKAHQHGYKGGNGHRKPDCIKVLHKEVNGFKQTDGYRVVFSKNVLQPQTKKSF